MHHSDALVSGVPLTLDDALAESHHWAAGIVTITAQPACIYMTFNMRVF
jgi:hypothetical protein